jgi:hypothetical protein
MMPLRYIYGQDELVADFVARMIPHVGDSGFGRCKAIGVVNAVDNELIAGWTYHHSNPKAGWIEISAAALPGRQWAPRMTWQIMYDVPFLQYRCQTVCHTVLASNQRLLRQLGALGCSLRTIPRLFSRQDDGVIALLTDDDWRTNKIFQRVHRQDVERKAA